LREWLRENSGNIVSLRRKGIAPHMVRHGTTMALLDAVVDISVIALWLGHKGIETTNGYLHTSLAVKEKALAKVTPTGSTFSRFRPDDDLVAFLASL
jgi:integrase/recombinase XerD